MESWGKRRRILMAPLCVAAVGIGLCASALGAEALTSIAEVKSAFDAAMGKPADEQVAALETVERQIDQAILDGKLAGRKKADGLYYKYHVQRHLAKFPDVYSTYADYIKAINAALGAVRARSTLLRGLGGWVRSKDYSHCAGVCEAVLDAVAQDAAMRSAAIYHLAWSRYWMNGTMNQCVQACDQLIEDYPDSAWRAKGLRLLANAYYSLSRYGDALSTLALLKQQYPNTKLAHYADMRPASIYEYGHGNPQKSLEAYKQTLQRYLDHMYAPYVHRQIARLQQVIESQLIQDALDDLAGRGPDRCDRKSLLTRAADAAGEKVAALPTGDGQE